MIVSFVFKTRQSIRQFIDRREVIDILINKDIVKAHKEMNSTQFSTGETKYTTENKLSDSFRQWINKNID